MQSATAQSYPHSKAFAGPSLRTSQSYQPVITATHWVPATGSVHSLPPSHFFPSPTPSLLTWWQLQCSVPPSHPRQSCPPSFHPAFPCLHPPDPFLPTAAVAAAINRACLGYTLVRSSDPLGCPVASRGDGRSRVSGSSSRRGRLLSVNSMSGLPSSGRNVRDSGRRWSS